MSSGKPRAQRSSELIAISRQLAVAVDGLSFPKPVDVVYNPLDYGRKAHDEFLRKYGGRDGVNLMIGMNPGPWGMTQTAVPFGAIKWVRDWMSIDTQVDKPRTEHPKRLVEGFACSRNEISGDRLWAWANERFGTADDFFSQFFVWNYCPLVFMVESGANLTPEKIRKKWRDPLFEICDEALRAVVAAINPRAIVGIGKFASDRAKIALPDRADDIDWICHPSPASPTANQGWAPLVERQLGDLGML